MRTIAGTARAMGVRWKAENSRKQETMPRTERNSPKRLPRWTAQNATHYPTHANCCRRPRWRSSTRAWTLRCVWVSIPSMPIRWSAAPSSCPRNRQDPQGRGCGQGRQGQGSAGGGWPISSGRGSGGEDSEGELDRFRLHGRDPRHDGTGRSARACARAQGSHAQPQGGHGYCGRGQGGT